ncbi:MAG: alpha/beta fold hydrolase [Mycobacteriales bacterium]
MPVELRCDDVGTGLPVVLLHAFPLSAAMWSAQREALSADYRVLTPDQRGFGGSPLGDDEPSLDAVADDVAALLDVKAIDRAVVGGLSMGGYVAMAFARRHPERLAGLVLADTKASADAQPARDKRERIARAVLAAGNAAVLLEEVLPTLLGDTSERERPEVVAAVRQMVTDAPAPAVAWAQRAMAARPESLASLRSVGVPTLVVVGAQDRLSPPEEAQQIVDVVPGAELRQIAAAGHLCAVETPAEFTRAVGDFLTRLS